MRRLVLFARSVIPPDPTQLFLLAGSVFLLISMHLRCYPVIPDYEYSSVFRASDSYQSWFRFSAAARIPIVFAGAAGLFTCFWPGIHPIRRILGFVLLPSFAGIVSLCGRFLYLSQQPDFPRASMMQGGPHNEAWAFRTIWSLGPAVHMSILGLVLVLVFLSRLATGVSTLPLSLPHAEDVSPADDKIWKQILALVWISITCVSVIGAATGLSVDGVYRLLERFVNYRLLPPADVLIAALSIACLGAIAAWAVGEGRWTELRHFLRPPGSRFAALGVIFPTAIELAPNLAAYVSDRVHWAAFEFGKLPPPIFASYFLLPNPLFLWYLIGAALEEVIWRGYLQPRFVQRFGLMQGIFLLAIAWSAFHFLGDFRRMAEDYQVFLQLVFRITTCIAMSYVLGWLTLRSRSIWPAALAHGLSNVWILAMAYSFDWQQTPFLRRIIVTACWGLLGFVLFRFWTPSIATEVYDQPENLAAEPTV